MKKVTVRCQVEVEVEFPDEMPDEQIRFLIEDNGCPGTGYVGLAIDKAIEHGKEHSVCWGCNLKGENKIVGGVS